MRAVMMIILLVLPFRSSEALMLSGVRKLYLASADSKEAAQALSRSLQVIDISTADPVFLCYKGVGQLMEAKFLINPLSKFDKFKSGKNMIEEAERRDTMSIEIRYLRFTVQTNLPAFLGYAANIISDKEFVLENFKDIRDLELKSMVWKFLSTSAYCSNQELKKLRN